MPSASGELQRLTPDPLGERLPFDELEDQRAYSGYRVGPFDAINRADVRMIERREQPRFALEPRAALCVGREDRRENLDRDVAAEPGVSRAIDLPHSSRSESGVDVVYAERFADQAQAFIDARVGAKLSETDSRVEQYSRSNERLLRKTAELSRSGPREGSVARVAVVMQPSHRTGRQGARDARAQE
jgi:hypothetical protein